MSPPSARRRRRLYRVYGSVLESSIRFPELRPAEPHAPPAWRFDLDDTLPAEPRGRLLGEEPIYGEVSARLLEAPDGGHRIHVGDTGTYHVSPDGASIRWRPRRAPWWDFGRAHLVGRVLVFAMHLRGVFTLHGSGVTVGGRALAFLGPKHQGKTTLALSLLGHGARLLTDDALPVEPPAREPFPGAVRVRPGVHAARLAPETRERLGYDPALPLNREGKAVVADLPRRRLALAPAPLAAIYLLSSRPPGGVEPAISRTRMDGVRAALALAGQQKIGRMLGPGAAPGLLDRATRVAERVPVYRLDLVRDMAHLDDAARRLLEWHRTDDASPGIAPARGVGAGG